GRIPAHGQPALRDAVGRIPADRAKEVAMRAVILVLCALFSLDAAAQYPAKPIRVIVPVAAGGNQEITIRAVAEEMAKRLAQPLPELIALAKARPGQLSYATSGIGSTGHIAMELFSRQAGIRMLHVPYKGNAQSLADVLGGQVQVMFDQMSTSLAHVNAGRL